MVDWNYKGTDNEVWFDKYKDLYDKECKWRDYNGDTKLDRTTNHDGIIKIVKRINNSHYNLFNFTDIEIDKLNNIEYTDRELEYFNKLKLNSIHIPGKVINHIINRVLGNVNKV